MSFFQLNMLTSLSPTFDEHQWVHHIRKSLDDELEEETEIPITVFGVPKALMLSSPDSYIPQQVAIGPYHHFRAEVYDMERYKVAAAKRNQRELRNLKLQDIVDHLIKFELRVRASYHRPVSFGPEALAWMLVVDVCFLFEFFQVCGVKKGKVLTKTPSRLACLIDLSGNKTAHNAILRDIVMLENQIPMFVIRMLLEFQLSSLDLADQLLVDMLIGFSNEISPFKMVEGPREIEMKESAHVLDFLYHFIVPKIEADPSEAIQIHEDEGHQNEDVPNTSSFSKPGHLRKFFDVLWQILSSLKPRPLEWIKSIIHSRPLKVILKLPWTILTKIPILKMLKGPIENAFNVFNMDKEKKDDEESSLSSANNNNNNKPPLLEEITIPSVTQLLEVGVQFVPTKEGITSIGFDQKTLTFYIPTIELDVNSEVVLRNLVAYEACSLMNGIIDTEEDAKMLCQRGIIINRLKSEKEVAELWNGMSRSIRLTKVPCLDRVIGDVNKYYNGRWKVKVGNFMKKYVFGSWKILTFLAAVMMLLLTSLQAFCQVYSCSRLVPMKALEPLTHS
ncbi:putative upf0481 protein at3g02645 [Phtheirospermum japonicum]|uniref:Putative upf0481 protein at3g02645 n=1 Tax=Phtheirospermum japonicum TaxID=374723 RepID=A0A830CTL5_9LAMI|nr:putative upf0481 protein at3g02645 [Phtheirospermum japonicum]